jgi:hypothetical protein
MVAIRDINKSDYMKKKKTRKKKEKRMLDIYMGGEKDPESLVVPEDLGKFFDKKRVFLVFFVLLIMLLIAGAGL